MKGSLRLGFLSGVMVLFWSAVAMADERDERARAELERQLSQLVSIPPPRLEVSFEGLDEPNFKLVEAEFALDGASLAVAGTGTLGRPELHKLFDGEVKPGEHALVSRVVYEDAAGILFSATGGYRWKVGGKVQFQAQRGLAVRVVARPQLVPGAKDPKQRFKLAHAVTAQMTAKLEDGTMPEPPKPQIVQVPAEVEPAGAAEEKKPSAAEEKKRKAEEARQARLAAAEEKKRQREEARLAAAEAKQRKAEEARQARLAAAEEKKRRGEAVRLAAAEPTPREEAAAPGEPPLGEVVPAVAKEPEAEDAGAPVAAPPPPPPAPSPPEPPAPEAGSPLPIPLLVAAGALVLAALVFLVTRRKR